MVKSLWARNRYLRTTRHICTRKRRTYMRIYALVLECFADDRRKRRSLKVAQPLDEKKVRFNFRRGRVSCQERNFRGRGGASTRRLWESRWDKWQTRPMGISLIRKLRGRRSLPVGFLLLAVELAIRLLQFIGKQFQVPR